MKKLLCAIILSALVLVSCGDGEEAESEKVTSAPDWRNSIEYEGSFYVDGTVKLLYSLDTGKITLWNNSGDGSVLQTLEYDSTVPDAIDRVETKDVNGDGYTDIVTPFSEADGKSFYNLFLWSEKDFHFEECKDFRHLENPVFGENGEILQTIDRGILGKVDNSFSFTKELELERASFEIIDGEATAKAIASALAPGDVALSDGRVTVNEEKCPLYTVTAGGEKIAYITCASGGDWYIDEHCKGVYRGVLEENGAIVRGEYPGAEGALLKCCKELLKLEDLDFAAVEKGKMGDSSAVKYTFSAENAFALINSDGRWYFSTDGEIYSELKSSDSSLGETVDLRFSSSDEDNTDTEVNVDVPELG